MLEEEDRGERVLTPVDRAVLLAFLQRNENGHDLRDNPPLSVVFERYYADKGTLPKTRLEWETSAAASRNK